MTTSDSCNVELEAQPIKSKLWQCIILASLVSKLRQCILALSRGVVALLDHARMPFFTLYANAREESTHTTGEDDGEGTHLLDSYPSVTLPGDGFPGMEIVSWKLDEPNAHTQYEGIVTLQSRRVVNHQFVQPRAKFSGILKVVSTFQSYDNKTVTKAGTAFLIDELHGLTAGHMVWDQKLGPAKAVVLYADERSQSNPRKIACVAVAVHAEWAKSHQSENDFAMIVVGKPLTLTVRPLQLKAVPRLPYAGTVIGFPSDLPAEARGSQLIECRGSVTDYRTATGRGMIEHEINTLSGSSGSPVLIDGEVIAVHSAFRAHEKKNYAVCINRNGNDVSLFESVLEHTISRFETDSDRISCLGETIHNVYREQTLFVFGRRIALSH
ncbi:trypsin-like cysteine/serine peptidase domain-containing protein [Xylaria telfairii]|nr:trypsin-like cysteine/serine peptidase domain-containing protein [Xylaria telfairii]